MAWKLDSDRPIYLQLVERIQVMIVSGLYEPGAKLPSVRDYAAEAAVNTNTMQKAFAELERSGLIITQRTNGRTVTDDVALIKQIRNQLAREQAATFMQRMEELGVSKEELAEILNEIQEETV